MIEDILTHTFKNYKTLFLDSLTYLDLATKYEGHIRTSLCRSSIISTALTVESVANSLIKHLNMEGKLYDEVEKLKAIAKYELYAHQMHGKKIEHSRHEYACINEIIKIRNDYVHPKVIHKKHGNNVMLMLGKYSVLGVNKNIDYWTVEDSAKCINSVVQFNNYFFDELLNIDPGQATGIIAGFNLYSEQPDVSTQLAFEGIHCDMIEKYIEKEVKYLKYGRLQEPN